MNDPTFLFPEKWDEKMNKGGKTEKEIESPPPHGELES